MKIRLINIDSKIPNLALMNLSAYHKHKGDIVGFDIDNPDIVYISCIFTKNASKAKGIAKMFPDAECIIGGSGVDLHSQLPEAAQKIMPDYSLYPSNTYSIGYTTRGCIRNCGFCIVPAKEGKLKRWMHIEEFHNPAYDTVICLDNNITADKKWFFENTDWIIDHNLKFNAIQGLDIRLITPEIADRLHELKLAGVMHFAWDHLADESAVRSGIEILQEAGINTRRDVAFYVLTGYDTSFAEDLYRCETLKSLQCGAYVMQYKRSPETQALARWTIRRNLFWGHDFWESGKIPEIVMQCKNKVCCEVKWINSNITDCFKTYNMWSDVVSLQQNLSCNKYYN